MDAAPTETRADLVEALVFANVTAKKLPQIVGNETWSTPWDRAHEYLNGILDKLVGR